MLCRIYIVEISKFSFVINLVNIFINSYYNYIQQYTYIHAKIKQNKS